MRQKSEKQRMKKRSKLSLWKAQVEYRGGRRIPPTLAKLSTRNICCQRGCKTGILYQGSLLGSSRRNGNLRYSLQLHGAPTDFFSSACWVKIEFCGAGGPRAGKATGIYSRRPCSTTSENFTHALDAVWLRGVPPRYDRWLVFLAKWRRKTTRSQQAQRSITTWLAHAVSTRFHRAHTDLDVMLSALATDSESIVKTVSEKELLCVKCGLQ